MRAPRTPCPTCPWRKSTPPGGFPGGCLDSRRLLAMAGGDPAEPAMQCHSTPDGEGAKVCVGFALQVGYRSVGLRIARFCGRYNPATIDADGPLHTLKSVLATHADVVLRPRGEG